MNTKPDGVSAMSAELGLMLAACTLLAACEQMTQPEDIELAAQLCSQRGGFASVSRHEHGKTLTINCKDGLHMQARLHEVKP